MRALETPRGNVSEDAYPLKNRNLPFLLLFANRRHINDFPIVHGASQSDGNTTSNDGSDSGTENLDFLSDD